MAGIFRYPKRKLRKLIKDGEYGEAITFGKSIESKFSHDHDFMFIMGSIYFIVEDTDQALPYFEKASSISPNDVETLTLKTNVHLALNQKDEAIKCCRHVVELQPKNAEARKILDTLENA